MSPPQVDAPATVNGSAPPPPPLTAPPPPPPSEQAAPHTDGLNLPVPPLTLDFSIRGDGKTEGYFQRYARKGDANDARAAVIGKGGFGIAYRFVRDDSFTPPNSLMDATVNSADYDVSRGSDGLRQAVKQQQHREHGVRSGESNFSLDTSAHHANVHAMRNHTSGSNRHLRSPGSVPTSPPQHQLATGASSARTTANVHVRNRAPAVVVVKICRTPTSGSYDELPKTGIGRAEAKAAAQEIAAGNPIGEHTRIVRGEARLLRYLQMCRAVEGLKGQHSHVVRLLSDIPMPRQTSMQVQDEDDESYSGPPVPRLLVFERLVDLDAELTPRGWAKSKDVWSVEKVETVSRDALAGLKFLHTHAIVHGDLKPSNFMRDSRTGAVKLIDLGASRRWVRLHNVAKERTTAVEELDKAIHNGQLPLRNCDDVLCEGLGSLTGSPHFMAPEVLLQAGRYLSSDGVHRNVLDDYTTNKSRLPLHPSVMLLHSAFRDFKRGWGIKADIWSWGCSMLSLLLRTIESGKRPSSNTVCAFDFSFESTEDALPPLWPLHASNDSLPKFHQWARLYALRIVSVVDKGVGLPEYSDVLSSPYIRALQASFLHQDARPTASIILDHLDSHASSNVEYMSEMGSHDVVRAPSRAHSIAPSVHTVSSIGPSHPEDPHNVDLTVSTSIAIQSASGGHVQEAQLRASGHDLAATMSIPGASRNGLSRNSSNLAVRESKRPLSSPALASLQIASTTNSHSPSLRPPNVATSLHRLSFHQPQLPYVDARGGEKSMLASKRSSVLSESGIQATTTERESSSPAVSAYTAITSPMTEAKSTPALARPTVNRSEDGSKIVESSLPNVRVAPYGSADPSSVANAVSAAEMGARRMSTVHPHPVKSRRGSIFARITSTLAPRLVSRESTSSMNNFYMSGEMTARPMQSGETRKSALALHVPEIGTTTTHSSPQMEYLHDNISPQHVGISPPGGQMMERQSAGIGNIRDAGEDTEMRDWPHSVTARQRKSTGYNLLGLEFGGSRHESMRPMRSFASLRSLSGNLSSSQQQQQHNDARLSTLKSPPPDGGGRYQGAHSTSHVPGYDNVGPVLQPSKMQHHHRMAASTKGGRQVSEHSAVQPHDSPSIASLSQGAPSFLQLDPYGNAASTAFAGTSGVTLPLIHQSQQRRQRSWSSLFRRNRQASQG